MSDVLKLQALPDEYEAMFNYTVKDIKDIVMKIRGNLRLYLIFNFIITFDL